MNTYFGGEKVCPRCKSSFGCGTGSQKGCWCDELPAMMPLEEGKGCSCPTCLKAAMLEKVEARLQEKGGLADVLQKLRALKHSDNLIEGLDYYYNEAGNWVFTAWYHLKRGACCKNGCRHCPYGFSKVKA